MRRKSVAAQQTAAAPAKVASASSDTAAGASSSLSALKCRMPNSIKMRKPRLSMSKKVIAGTDASHDAGAESKQKRSIHLSISPDTESESMQVMLMDQLPSPIKQDDCTYLVDSVEYLVKHGTGNDENTSPIKKTLLLPKNCEEVAAEGGGSEKKKKSKMGGLFKKSPKKGGDGGADDGKKESSNNGGGGGDKNGDKKDDSGDGKDNGKDENKDDGDSKDNNNNNPNNGRPFDPHTHFGPERTAFAKEATLPLHSGSESTAPTNYPSWTPVDGTEFKVRAGPNYPKNGKKESSLESLYEVYCVRYFRSGKRTVGGATRIMPLPDHNTDSSSNSDERTEQVPAEAGTAADDDAPPPAGGGHNPELKGTKIPDVLVVHFMLPYEPPNMFKQKDDGQGGECIYYLRPSKRLLDEISGRMPISPATQLFAKWCETCEGDLKMRSRFKCMALVRDIDKHNFGLLKNYNGKPVLITESGRACSGYHGDVRYLEMTANVHYWAFMAKKGFVSLIPKFANMQMEVGFTIEGHTDSELPECVLGSTVLSYVSDKTGPMIQPGMQEPVHEHQS